MQWPRHELMVTWTRIVALGVRVVRDTYAVKPIEPARHWVWERLGVVSDGLLCLREKYKDDT